MRKFMFIMATIVALFMNAHEQKVLDNTYVTLKGGVTALMHPGCNGYKNLGHTFEAATALEAGKWITPHWGASIIGTNGWTNGSKVGVFQDDYAVNYVTVGAMAKYRINANRWNFVGLTGPMWIHGFRKDNPDNNNLGVKFGLEANYNLNEKFSLQIAPELNYNFEPSNGNQPYFDARNAWYGLMIGITYNIGNKFTKCKYTQSDIDALNAQINELRNRTPETVERIVERTIVKNVVNDEYVIFFDKNHSTLSQEAKATLNKITGSVIIQGHASEEGTYARNEILSKERANIVAEYLKARGVNVLGAEGMGATGNRVAIIIVK